MDRLLPSRGAFVQARAARTYFDVLWKSTYLYAGTGPLVNAASISGIAALGAGVGLDIYQVDDDAYPNSHNFLSEPVDDVYRTLLAFAETHSERFSLTWQRQLAFDAAAASIEVELKPFLIEEVETSAWPGTELLGPTAVVRTYRVLPKSIEVLVGAGGLYAWQSPQRPEDLAFYTADGRCWLGSTAHERDGFVILDSSGLTDLRAAVPGLELSK